MIAVDLSTTETIEVGPGLRVSFPLQSASGTASTATVLMELQPGAVVPEHQDSAEELLIVLEGEAEASVGNESGRLAAGQVALVPAMAPHGVRNVGTAVLRVLGTFSSSTVVSTFAEPFGPDGEQVVVIGSPVQLAAHLREVSTLPA